MRCATPRCGTSNLKVSTQTLFPVLFSFTSKRLSLFRRQTHSDRLFLSKSREIAQQPCSSGCCRRRGAGVVGLTPTTRRSGRTTRPPRSSTTTASLGRGASFRLRATGAMARAALPQQGDTYRPPTSSRTRLRIRATPPTPRRPPEAIRPATPRIPTVPCRSKSPTRHTRSLRRSNTHTVRRNCQMMRRGAAGRRQLALGTTRGHGPLPVPFISSFCFHPTPQSGEPPLRTRHRRSRTRRRCRC